jgi:hypothetical protein
MLGCKKPLKLSLDEATPLFIRLSARMPGRAARQWNEVWISANEPGDVFMRPQDRSGFE